MNFLKKLFGKLGQTDTAPVVESEVPIKKEQERTAYFELVGLLSQDNERAIQGMVYALDDPAKFIEQYQKMFAEWFSVEITVEEIKAYPLWELFSYVLYDEGYLTMNDWKAEAEDFIYFVEEIVNKYDEKLEHSQITNKEEMAPEVFEQLKAALPQGFTLINIDIDSDSYQLTVVPTAKVEMLKAAAAKVNGKIDCY
ncbi:hypothetical protein I6N96_15075 [Enterococcus sp. BWM-S5]|uniref:DUF6630 domain-containing protein n=1 Tax=Enterococcus larvae TaxID=2794352 RepID=A0ABS4CM90_9ENTE|nr:hypothetical protein [Enterococcus larvae]MBP1047608.1 hypothetical protein [Enterococcus larvae]